MLVFYSALLGTFLCFIYLRAYMDYWLIELEGIDLKGNYKLCTSIITCIVSAYISVIFAGTVGFNPFITIVTLLLTYGLLFDTILNKLRDKKYNYLGEGPVDTFYSQIPYHYQVRVLVIISLIILNYYEEALINCIRHICNC